MPHHVVIPERFADIVLARRKLVVGFILLSTIACFVYASFTPVRTSITQGFMPDDGAFEQYRENALAMGGSADDVILLATAEGDELFTPNKLDAIRATARELTAMPEVARVDTFVDAPWLAPNRTLSAFEQVGLDALRQSLAQGIAPDLSSAPQTLYWPESKRAQQNVDFDALRQALTGLDPLTGALVSRDGESQLMLIQLSENAPKQWLTPARFADRLKEIARENGLGANGVHTAGVLVTEGGMIREAARSVYQLVPLGVAVICLLVFAVFRKTTLVILTLAIAIPSVAWAVGATALIFGRITLLIASAPLLITVISTSDTIHIASAYLAELASGKERASAIRRTIADVGGACVLTSVTTFIGFMSLMVVPAAALRHFSLSISVGVASALMLALMLCPIAFSLIDLSRQRKPIWGLAQVNSLIERFVAVCRRISLGLPRTVVAFHLLVFISAIYVTTQQTMDADLPARFPAAHGVKTGIEFLNAEFDGANSIELYFQADNGSLATQEFVGALGKIEDRVSDDPAVGRVVSLATMINSIESALQIPADDPLTQKRLQGELDLLRNVGGDRIAGVLSANNRLARMTVQTPLTRVFEIERLARRIEGVCHEVLTTGISVEATGAYTILGAAVQNILTAQIQGFTICFLTVMTIVGFGVRSVRLAALAVVPNLFPLALLGGILWLTTEVVDPDILGVAIVSFGLAVDDTIHFLHRYDIERAQTNDIRQALERTFDYTGLAIVRTTVILGLGLSVLSFSGYLSVWFLGTYLVFVLGTAVLGDMLLLPSLILLFDARPSSENAS